MVPHNIHRAKKSIKSILWDGLMGCSTHSCMSDVGKFNVNFENVPKNWFNEF